jgi:hypothetical protein
VLLCTVVVCCCLLLGVLVCCCVLLRVRGVKDTHSIRCLDISLGRVAACDAGDPGSIPDGGKLNVLPLPGGQMTSTHYSQYKLSR